MVRGNEFISSSPPFTIKSNGNLEDMSNHMAPEEPHYDTSELERILGNESHTISEEELLCRLQPLPHLNVNNDSVLYNEWQEGSREVCSQHWDKILCWPAARNGEIVTLPCFSQLNGIAYDTSRTVSRLCEEGGFWQNKTNYSNCVPLHSSTLSPETNRNLEITTGVYFAGYCLSLTGLVIAFLIFLLFKELRCLRNKIHTHLIITYILADALWIITSVQSHMGQNSSHHASCVTFILLHYFHLTNFFWMFVEGLYLYILVVQTFVAENIKLRLYASIGWGCPILVVVSWCLAKWFTKSQNTDSGDLEIQLSACVWINENLWDWIYKAPAILVLAANILFLLQIMWVLITKLRSATNPETQQSRKAAKALVVLMPLLGITYLLVMTGSKKTPFFEHIRALLISTQGFLVALLYCFLNGEVRVALRHRWNRIRLRTFCSCCEEESRRNNVHHIRECSPRSRTESLRLCMPGSHLFRKQESTGSEMTSLTTIGGTLSVPANGQPTSPRRSAIQKILEEKEENSII